MLPFSPAAFQEHLATGILPFWTDRMVDPVNGGFYGRIDAFGQLHSHSDKAVILNTRILWTFSAAYRELKEKRYLAIADRCFDYLVKHFIDTQHGGVYWMVDYLGNKLDGKKQIYAQAFAIYAFSEYAMASNSKEALQYAKKLFSLIETNAYDDSRNGYLEAFAEDWTELKDVRLSEKDMNAQKTMNTHLHILEAYTNLYRVWKSDALQNQLINLVELMTGDFVSEDGHFNLFFDSDWELLSNEISYGHDIEGSWLLQEALEVLNDSEFAASKSEVIIRMAKVSLEGLDTDGGLMNEGINSLITDRDKHWWPQAEAMVGLVNLATMTGDDNWKSKAAEVWNFVQENLIDESGEWYWRIDEEGEIVYSEDLAGPWKAPYHNGRAMLELIRRLK